MPTTDTPRYVKIFNVLSRRLESGKYPVGMRLPTESELCEEFKASRFTVRESLRRLVEQGMVQRRQGAGSVVVAAKPQARYVHTLSSLGDLFQFALDTHYELVSLKQVAIPEDIAQDIGGVAGERWWQLKGLRCNEKGGKPFIVLHSYVAPRAGDYVRELEHVVGPFYAHLAQRTGEEILGAEQDLHGAPMTAEISGQLQVKTGTIGMCALRRYLTKKGTLIASYNWHVAEKFHYRMKMSRDV
jgi:DNA-binding GntR family transcriptional regulator